MRPPATVRRPRAGVAASIAASQWRSLVALLGMGLCAACAPFTGDLGRPAPSIWNDTILPGIGHVSALARGEDVSAFRFTDDEEELRARAWRYVMPAHERSWFHREVQELARTRIIPVSWQSTEERDYFAALVGGTFRSEHSRYRRLCEDALADAALIKPFRAVAGRVASADVARMKTAALSPAVTPPSPENAAARVAENEGMVAWVRERLRYRLASYRHALDNLVVEMPSREAVMAERCVMILESEMRQLEIMAPQHYQLGAPIAVRG
jgi:hypothetical protein